MPKNKGNTRSGLCDIGFAYVRAFHCWYVWFGNKPTSRDFIV